MSKLEKIENIVIVYDYGDINGGAAKVAVQSALGLKEYYSSLNIYYFAAVGPMHDDLAKYGIKTKCLFIEDINGEDRKKAIINGIWNSEARTEFIHFLDDNHLAPQNTVIHIHGWSKALSSSIIAHAKKSKYAVFITLHDYFCVCPNGGFYDYKKQIICRRKPMSLSCLFCNCDKRSYAQKIWRSIRQIVQDHWIRRNPDIYYLSISDLNQSIASPYVKSSRIIRVVNPIELGEIDENIVKTNTILYVGRLSEEKGIELFCSAVASLDEEISINAIVVGSGSCINELKEKYSQISFVGWKNSKEVSEYMKAARVVVLPSKWYEGAPLTVLESMSVGTPCIVSDCTAAVEEVEDDCNGYVFKTNDVNDLKNKFRLAFDDDNYLRVREKLIIGFNREKYTLRNHIECLMNAYNEALYQ